MRIVLQSFWMTDEQSSMADLGLKDIIEKLTECELRTIYLYRIDAITPYHDKYDDDRVYSKVYCNGDYWICNQTPEEIDALIRYVTK